MGKRHRVWIVGAATFLAALLVGFAFVIFESQKESRRGLEDRFSLRAALASSFTASFVDSVVLRERTLASRRLWERDVSDAEFSQVVGEMGFQEAILLDRSGRVLRVWPRNPDLLGKNVGGSSRHFSQALSGQIGVSDSVASGAKRTPIVAFAVPFASSEGRRVFSGAFAIGRTPVATYLDNALPYAGGELSVVDATGSLVVTNRPEGAPKSALAGSDPALARALRRADTGTYQRDGKGRYYARHPIEGTPWQLVASVSLDLLLAPISGEAAILPWILFAAFAAAVGALLALLVRLGQESGRLAISNKSLAGSNRSLADSNDELRELDRLKDEFVALVSHELRTPLTSIIGYVRLLVRGRAGPVPQEQRELLAVVERNALRLLRLIGDLLLAAKADAGKLKLEPEDLDLDVLVAECVESAQPAAQNGGITLDLQAGGEVPVYGDRARIVQLLDNLISNAIKFSLDGCRVDVRVAAKGSAATIEVADRGIGIPPEEQGRLFERFFRASSATGLEIQGSGLGLSVVKTIVELHGGTVEFSSDEHGTTFFVTLPLAQPQEAAA